MVCYWVDSGRDVKAGFQSNICVTYRVVRRRADSCERIMGLRFKIEDDKDAVTFSCAISDSIAYLRTSKLHHAVWTVIALTSTGKLKRVPSLPKELGLKLEDYDRIKVKE